MNWYRRLSTELQAAIWTVILFLSVGLIVFLSIVTHGWLVLTLMTGVFIWAVYILVLGVLETHH